MSLNVLTPSSSRSLADDLKKLHQDERRAGRVHQSSEKIVRGGQRLNRDTLAVSTNFAYRIQLFRETSSFEAGENVELSDVSKGNARVPKARPDTQKADAARNASRFVGYKPSKDAPNQSSKVPTAKLSSMDAQSIPVKTKGPDKSHVSNASAAIWKVNVDHGSHQSDRPVHLVINWKTGVKKNPL